MKTFLCYSLIFILCCKVYLPSCMQYRDFDPRSNISDFLHPSCLIWFSGENYWQNLLELHLPMAAYMVATLNYINCTVRALWSLTQQNNIPTEINLRF